MPAMPGDPEDVIIFYGQSRSIVRMLISRFGPGKMRELMATLQAGANVDRAFREVYGFGLQGLDAMWRGSLGLEPLELTTRRRSRPTAVPQRVPLLYSLTPQADSEVVGDQAAEATPTPTPTSTPTFTPSPTPEPEPTPTPEPTVAPAPEVAVAAPTEETPTSAPAADEEPQQTGGGGACNASLGGPPAPLDLAAVAFLLGLTGLGLGKRRRG
jgi:hypothetical protein